MKGQRVQVVERLAVLRTASAVPPEDWQAGGTEELQHDDRARVLHQRDVELGVAEEQLGRRLGHVLGEENEDGHNDGQDELQAVGPRVMLQVLDVGPYALIPQPRRDRAEEAAPPQPEHGKHEVRVGVEAAVADEHMLVQLRVLPLEVAHPQHGMTVAEQDEHQRHGAEVAHTPLDDPDHVRVRLRIAVGQRPQPREVRRATWIDGRSCQQPTHRLRQQ